MMIMMMMMMTITDVHQEQHRSQDPSFRMPEVTMHNSSLHEGLGQWYFGPVWPSPI